VHLKPEVMNEVVLNMLEIISREFAHIKAVCKSVDEITPGVQSYNRYECKKRQIQSLIP
jgi:hypothetical protein